MKKKYNNKWIAALDKIVVDSDSDLDRLTERLRVKHIQAFGQAAISQSTRSRASSPAASHNTSFTTSSPTAKHGKKHNKPFWNQIHHKYPNHQKHETKLLATGAKSNKLYNKATCHRRIKPSF